MGRMAGVLRGVWRIGWKLAVVAAIAGAVIYRMRFAPVPVTAHSVARGPITAETLGTGTLEARVQVNISTRISGPLAQVTVDQGDRITKGQLLATLDDADQQKQIEMAQADVEAAKAAVARAEADIASAKATVTYARTNYTRTSQLAIANSVSKDEIDKALSQRDVAEAQLQRSELAKVESDRQVAKAESTLRYYQQLLADTKITAPFDGLVVHRDRDPGGVVVPGSSILQVIATDAIWVSAWVDETAMSALAVGQPVRVVFRSEPGRSYRGTVTRMAPLADRETREFLVDVTVQELPKTWAIGQRAEVYIQTAHKEDVLQVPAAAILWQKGQAGVFVEQEGRAAWRAVELGLRGSQTVEINSGLSGGQRVIWASDPQGMVLTAGRAVRLP
jgi:HlyD family secretion protein